MSDDRDQWSIYHFSQSNPTGKGQGDVAALLRRVADSLDALGDVQVQDITFASQTTTAENDLTVTVYYARDPDTVQSQRSRQLLDSRQKEVSASDL